MTTNPRTSRSSICLVLVLYLLQGMNLGLTVSLPLFLVDRGATWKDRGIFNFAIYPFSLKLIWAPLIDALYSDRFGRRKSWLVPIHLSMAGIFLWLSFYIESFIATTRVVLLTVIFFAIVFLTATHDICVDGLAISLFTETNPQWASTSQTIGQTFGRLLGSSVLMTFESAIFTNRYIREPLSLPPQTTGLFSIEQFVRFVAIAYLGVSTCLIVFFREKQNVLTINGEKKNGISIAETYLSIVKLFKKKCMGQLSLVSLLSPIGLVAIDYMTQLSLVGQGVPRANLGLVNIPVVLVSLVAPLVIRHTDRPLIWFAGSYVLCLINAIPIGAYVYFTPYMLSSNYYYPVLILLFALNEFFMALRITGHIGFFASISEPRIGGTYMTFLVTILNLGFALNSSAILYAANWLPKRYAYVIAVGSCILLGILWIGLSYRTLKRLQMLPMHKWYVAPEVITNDANTLEEQGQKDHEVSLIPHKETGQTA